MQVQVIFPDAIWRISSRPSDSWLAAIEQLSFEERAQLGAWMHGWKDDEWDEQMKRDVATGKVDDVLREVEDDIRTGSLRDTP